ncbi:MAG: nicotinate-nucleotide adenylyltransferase [Gammaproteobacteria bacterium]|nr:nicotinate-nucleotide adenylyltransferase [Gammaproteobacteria bacterium]
MIGIFGGTFDPIHYGHLRTALEVMQGAGLDEVRFIPLHQAVHREQPVVGGRSRLQMIRAAIRGQPGFVADDRELRRQGESYTVDTLGSLRAEFGDRSICLIVGGDAFREFLTWHRPLEILDLANLIVMQRPGHSDFSDPSLQALISERKAEHSELIRQQPAGRIFFQPVTQLEISATRIRAMVAAGASARYLMPEAVLRVIQKNNHYSG